MTPLAERLVEARTLSGLSRRQACNLHSFDVELLRSWEEGSAAPTPEDLESLAHLYDVRLDWLSTGAPPSEPVDLRGLQGLAPADVAKVARMLEIVRRDR